MRRYVGVDPGHGGAIAAIADGAAPLVLDMPLCTVERGRRQRAEYDEAEMRAILLGILRETADVFVALEAALPHPNDGKAGWLRTGLGVGIWRGLLAGVGVPFRLVPAVTWKKAQGLAGQGKGAARLEAGRRFPGVALGRVKDHGRAEALLLADYARKLGW